MPASMPDHFQQTALHNARVELQNETVFFKAETQSQHEEEPTPSILGSFFVTEQEEIAQFVETLARRCVLPCDLYEPFQHFVGLHGYRLWAKRVENATGIMLRSPRLSYVCDFGIPRDITGHEFHSDTKIKAGQTFDYETACRLIKDKITTPVQVTSKSGIKSSGYLRFFDNKKPGSVVLQKFIYSKSGKPAMLKFRKINVRTAADVKPFLALEDTECEWGEQINIHRFDACIPFFEAICSVPDTYFAVHRNGEYYLCGESEEHQVVEFDPAWFVDRHRVKHTIFPALFSPENAEPMLARLRKYLPECEWNLVPSAEIKAALLGVSFATL
jgi:hypothetical protein